jgi:2-polyprenyl-3-methyl-5-hydroxy-6-metoxy-1,4-benzoquinol methylase
MLAPNTIPHEFRVWNQKYKSPFGALWWVLLTQSRLRFPGRDTLWANRMNLPFWLLHCIGPFGYQQNSPSRKFEYPWCFFATPLHPGMHAVEIGAGASGFQFVMVQQGVEVISVDPLINPNERVDWRYSREQFSRLNDAFGGQVTFIQDYLQNAHLQSNHYDRVFCVSVIEHLAQAEIEPLVKEIKRILKPGGFLVATIDLFLDCYPFTDKVSNEFGSNISVRSLIEQSGFVLKKGSLSELYGYPEFNPHKILKKRHHFLCFNNTLTQCLVLEKIP